MENKLESSVGTSNITRDININCYDGLGEYWRSWSAKFLARAEILGYKSYFEGKEEVHEHNLMSYVETNKYAYGDIILNCDGIAFSIVEMSKTENFPDGDAKKAWLLLKERFEAETYVTKVQLRREYVGCRLGKGQDLSNSGYSPVSFE